MPPITDAATLDRLKALSRAMDDAGSKVHSATEAAEEIGGRERELLASLAAHDAAEPSPDPDISDELSGMLAADPTADVLDDWRDKLRDAQDAKAGEIAAWKGKRRIIGQAFAKLAAARDEQATVLAAAQAAHDDAYGTFLAETKHAIVAEFRSRWQQLQDELLAPLAAMKRPRKLYGEGFHDSWAGGIRYDSALSVDWPDATMPSGRGACILYPIQADATAITADAVQSFRDALTEAAPGKGTRTR